MKRPLGEVDEKELQSCYEHLVYDEPLKIASDVSFTSAMDVANPEALPGKKLKEIEDEMRSLGFNVPEIQRLQNYIRNNEDFLLLAHSLRMGPVAREAPMGATEIQRIFTKAKTPDPADFKSGCGSNPRKEFGRGGELL